MASHDERYTHSLFEVLQLQRNQAMSRAAEYEALLVVEKFEHGETRAALQASIDAALPSEPVASKS